MNFGLRLDEILAKHNGELGVTWEDPDVVTPDTKQALTSLIKELVAEAKPSNIIYDTASHQYSHDNAVNEYHNNLLKALEEV